MDGLTQTLFLFVGLRRADVAVANIVVPIVVAAVVIAAVATIVVTSVLARALPEAAAPITDLIELFVKVLQVVQYFILRGNASPRRRGRGWV